MNFNYFISEIQFEFLLDAVDLIASEGWKLLPHYRFCPQTGLWRHRAGRPDPAMRLSDVTYATGRMEYRSLHRTEPEAALAEYIAQARAVIAEAQRGYGVWEPLAGPELNADFESLRWFPLPTRSWPT